MSDRPQAIIEVRWWQIRHWMPLEPVVEEGTGRGFGGNGGIEVAFTSFHHFRSCMLLNFFLVNSLF